MCSLSLQSGGSSQNIFFANFNFIHVFLIYLVSSLIKWGKENVFVQNLELTTASIDAA